jgi:Acyltransferase family
MRTERPAIRGAVSSGDARQAPWIRVHYLDWLRALAVLGVFVYHLLQPFSTHDWHVKNDRLSDAIDGMISFVDPWGIAFFFLIAGASTFLALRWRTARQYMRERLMRLLVPLVVAYLLLSPMQALSRNATSVGTRDRLLPAYRCSSRRFGRTCEVPCPIRSWSTAHTTYGSWSSCSGSPCWASRCSCGCAGPVGGACPRSWATERGGAGRPCCSRSLSRSRRSRSCPCGPRPRTGAHSSTCSASSSPAMC